VGEDAGEEFAVFGLAGDDGASAVVLGVGALGDVEAELGLALLFIGAVAIEALVGKDRADVAIEAGRLWNGRAERCPVEEG
jgi:hypothetical protein